MRQHIINGWNVNGHVSNVSLHAVVAGRDVRIMEPRLGKRLMQKKMSRSSQSVSSEVSRGVHVCVRPETPPVRTATVATPRLVPAFEAPATAWAALVITRATSV